MPATVITCSVNTNVKVENKSNNSIPHGTHISNIHIPKIWSKYDNSIILMTLPTSIGEK